MATPNFAADLPELTRTNRDLLWRKGRGILIGLTIALLVFGGVINITTFSTPYIGDVIEFILAWGGVLWALLSIVDIILTLGHLHRQHIVDDAVKQERERASGAKTVRVAPSKTAE